MFTATTTTNSEAWILALFFTPPLALIIILLSGLVISRTKYYKTYHESDKKPGQYMVISKSSHSHYQLLQQQQQQRHLNEFKIKKNNNDASISINSFINNSIGGSGGDDIIQKQKQHQEEEFILNEYLFSYKPILKKLTWLKIAMKIHGIADLIGGSLLFIWPESAFIWFGFQQNDNVVFLRLVAAALFAITYVSIKASFTNKLYHIIKNIDMNTAAATTTVTNNDKNVIKYYIIIDKENITYLSAILDFKIIWSGTVSLVSIFYSLEKVLITPQELPIAWGTWLIMVIFILGFITWTAGKITVNMVIKQLKSKLSISVPSSSLQSTIPWSLSFKKQL